MIRSLLLLSLLTTSALAWDRGQSEGADPKIAEWFGRQRVPDAPGSSCCGVADAYWADSMDTEGDRHIAIITDEREIVGRKPIAPGTRIVVPKEKMNNGRRAGTLDPNPTGHGVIFINPNAPGGQSVLCYFAPGGV